MSTLLYIVTNILVPIIVAGLTYWVVDGLGEAKKEETTVYLE
jgi:hypothetical protein